MSRRDLNAWGIALGLGATLWAARGLLRAARRVDFSGRHVLITGGSRGLGLVLARHFARAGARLTLLARTAADLDWAQQELATQYGADVLALPCDVRRRAEVEEAVGQAVARFGRLDALVHVAGVIEVGPERHMDEADYRQAMETHFWGAYFATEAALPHLPRDGSARVGYVSSIGGRVAVPHLAPYAASKRALTGYSDAMRSALARENIPVTTITPGLMRTGSHPNAQFKGQHEKEYAWFSIADANPLLSTSAEHAARAIFDALAHGAPALTITWPARLAAALDGVAPGLTGRALNLAARLLPGAAGPEGDRRQSGWQSFSDASPGVLTHPADAAISENNETRGHADPA